MKLVRYADDFVVMVRGTRADADALWDEVGDGARTDGPAPVGREDQGLPHRRGVRLPRLAHPAPRLAKPNREESGLHLPVEEDARVDHRQGAGADPQSDNTERSQTCCAGSTRCCGAGATTSATACPRGPSATSITSPSGGSSAGCANDTCGLNWHTLIRRFLPGWKIRAEHVEMFHPNEVAIVRYRYRGTRIPTPWSSPTTTAA